MKLCKLLLISATMVLMFPLVTKAQYFQAYYQSNYKWSGSKFISDTDALTSTKFHFDGDQLTIDNQSLTITNRISNSNGDYITAVSNLDRSLRVSITIDLQTDAKGKKFKCITVERAKAYKIVYYIN